jgi:formylglycine-generating enzyme required for sulfatase activity
VSEWCEDEYKASMNDSDALDTNPALKNEKGADGTPFRVLRGGSWPLHAEFSLRSSCRDLVYPTDRYVSVGFRLVVAVGGGG